MTTFTAFSDAMTGTNSGYGGQSPGCDVREVILVANLNNVYSGPVQASVTIKSQGGSNGTLASAWIGSSGGGTNNVNFKGDQVQIKWSGSNSLALSGAQTYTPSDLTATFNYDPTVPLVISLFFTGTNCTAASHTGINGAAGNNYNLSHADQTAATTATYANADNFYSWVSKIDLTEIATDPGPSVRRNPSYRTAVFAPAVAWAPNVPTPIAPTVVFPVLTPDPIRPNYQPAINSTTQPVLGLAFRTAITPSAGFDLTLQDDRPIARDYRVALASTTAPQLVVKPIVALTPNLGFDLTLQDDRPIVRDYRSALASTTSPPFIQPPIAPVYYVDSAIGSDSNDGLSPATAWQTIAKVNAQTWNGNGTYVLFNGSQTFNGTITPLNGLGITTPLVFGSYGGGRATINGGSVGGFLATGMGGITVRDLIFVGASTLTNTADGIRFDNNQAGNTALGGVSIINCTVSGFGLNGILLIGTNGRSGFNGVLIDGCVAHDCTGNYAGNAGSGGIMVFSPFTGYGILAAGGATHSNVTIQNCTAYNNLGKGGATNWVGSGIFLGEANNGLIQNCVAYQNGANSNFNAGPVGIWTADATNVVIQFCESYNNATLSNIDGDGFDLDGGCQNCTIQYCYSQGNFGAGFQVYTYDDPALLQDTNKVVRFCISQNDATFSGAGIVFGSDSGRIHNADIYNNTIFNDGSVSGPCFGIGGVNIAGSTGHIANNIFYSTNNAPLIAKFPTDGNPVTMTMVGNDYYNTGTFSIRWNSTTYTTYASWQTATGQEKISGSNVGLTSDPLLVRPGTAGIAGGYNPAALGGYIANPGSPVIGGGQNLLSLYSINVGSQDFFGNPALLHGSSVGADSQFASLFIAILPDDRPIRPDYRIALGSTTFPVWPTSGVPSALCELGTIDGSTLGLFNFGDTLAVLSCSPIVVQSLIDRPSTIYPDYRSTLLSTTYPVKPVFQPPVTVPTFPIFSNKEGIPISPDYSRALYATSAVAPRVFTPLVTLTPSFWVQNPDYTLPDWW